MRSIARPFTAALLAATLAWCAVPSYAQPQSRPGPEDGAPGQAQKSAPDDLRPIDRYLELKQELGLSDTQARQLQQIREDFRARAAELRTSLKNARAGIRKFMQQEPSDFAAVREATRQASDLDLQLKLARIDALEQGGNALTAEQREKLRQLLKERKAERPRTKRENPRR